MDDRGKPRPPPPDDCPLERYLNVVSGAGVPRILWPTGRVISVLLGSGTMARWMRS